MTDTLQTIATINEHGAEHVTNELKKRNLNWDVSAVLSEMERDSITEEIADNGHYDYEISGGQFIRLSREHVTLCHFGQDGNPERKDDTT